MRRVLPYLETSCGRASRQRRGSLRVRKKANARAYEINSSKPEKIAKKEAYFTLENSALEEGAKQALDIDGREKMLKRK